jgi:hypothetical protein
VATLDQLEKNVATKTTLARVKTARLYGPRWRADQASTVSVANARKLNEKIATIVEPAEGWV